jgi:hypothetical protein
MHSRLPRRLPDIYPDVVSVGRMLGMDALLGLAQKLDDSDLFLRRHIEEVSHVALRDYEHVATTQ